MTSEQNRALAAALRAAGQKDVRPVWPEAKQLAEQGLDYAEVAKRVVKVSEPVAKYHAKLSSDATKKGIDKLVKRPKAKQRKPAASKRVKAAKQAPKPKTRKVSEPTVQYNTPPASYNVVLVRDGTELPATLRVWPERPKQRGNGVTHTAALVVDGAMQALTLSKRALKNLRSGVGTWLWYGGEGHLATLAQ